LLAVDFADFADFADLPAPSCPAHGALRTVALLLRRLLPACPCSPSLAAAGLGRAAALAGPAHRAAGRGVFPE